MKSFSKILAIMWWIAAGFNFLAWIAGTLEFEWLIIATLECIIGNYNWKDHKRGE